MRFALWCIAACGSVLVLAVGALYVQTERRLGRTYVTDVRPLSVTSGPETLPRGEHLVRAVANCAWCHGADLGGRQLLDVWWIGRVDSANLTPGRGGISELDDVELVRVLRHGVDSRGRSLALQPAQYLRRLSDRDASAIIAYLRSVPAVDRVAKERRIGPLSRLALVLGQVPDIFPAETVAGLPSVAAHVPEARVPAYGRYLVDAANCRLCHRDDLSGGPHPLAVPGEPPAPDLTAGGALPTWSLEQFAQTLRTGTTPGGRVLDPVFMPWPAMAALTDLEIEAIWLYLKTL